MDVSNVNKPASPVPSSAAVSDADPASPALSALARFEFQAGKGKEGTKILMVEWDPSTSHADAAPSAVRTWQVSWEGKTSHLPVDDEETGTNKRVYFLLPPGSPIPPVVTITHPDGVTLTTKPLPAIFPPGLSAASSESGTRGILHTIWAKKRLAELQIEIDTEMKTNFESVGLEIALQERQWITDHFGVTPRVDMNTKADTSSSAPGALPSPISPRSPVSGKLGEKLKGLRLATSAADLVAGSAGKHAHLYPISFSPASGDLAVSSFSNFARQPSKMNLEVSHSLDAVLGNNNPVPPTKQDHDQEEDLFALPMSPRSPEMGRSPFSLR
ncbi:hypothetical protein CkaCkLH20_13088 [Colletotrichum karsti]|uniref:Uncharacterized protein n=1 Tax=Colletotrichum karsti TaxID=1095194 RepID=A0A9P6HV90_9PEZI|nr:uncharacterized protein CkaCkLH20_13088 [Colletotrichum karsti]KAF9869426.1 hypothetical protein CkaCkLH20_13088 [Colletotrichum karsti]